MKRTEEEEDGRGRRRKTLRRISRTEKERTEEEKEDSVLRAKAIRDARFRNIGRIQQVRFDTSGAALPTNDRPLAQRESGTLRARQRAGDVEEA